LYCTGIQKIPIIGAYLLPEQKGLDDLHNHVQPAFNQYPSTRYAPVFMGDFNVDLDTNSPNDLNRQQEVLDFMAANGDLQSMVPHFKQRRRYEKMGNTTWFQTMEDGTIIVGGPSVITSVAETDASLPMLLLENLKHTPRLIIT